VIVEWAEVVRAWKDPGIFHREGHALDRSIDVDSPAARSLVEEIVRTRVAASRVPYDRVELSLHVEGDRRHECLLPKAERPTGDALRAAHVLAAAHPRIAAPGDRDRFELRIVWDAEGRPALAGEAVQRSRTGEVLSAGLDRVALGQKLEALSKKLPREAMVTWVAADGSELKLRSRRAFSTIEALWPLPPALTAEVEALVSGDGTTPLRDPAWLPLLAARFEGKIDRLAAELRCARCAASHTTGAVFVEARFDTRTGGLWGEKGVAYTCPRGHELARIVEVKA
jgi:hypothetical protein